MKRKLRLVVILVAVCLCWPAPSRAQVSVRQGNFQYSPLNPIQENESIAGFYRYDLDFDASAHTGFEASQKSILFLYSEPFGPGLLSLVFIHDIYEDGSGGDASFDVTGLPSGVYYSVHDDPPFGMPQDYYAPDPPAGGQTTMRWSWAECCTDGAALTGLQGQAFCIAVAPQFINGINGWQLIDGDGPSRIDLPSLTETVYLCGDCQTLECPPVVTAECIAQGTGIASVQASGTSLCPGGVVENDRTGGGEDASGRYPLGTTAVTFTLTDAPGFESTCETQVVIVDTTPPVIMNCPATLELPCGEGPIPVSDPRVQTWLQSFQAEESCLGLTLLNDAPQTFLPDCQGEPIPIRFEARDDSGNASFCDSGVLIADLQPPVVTSCPPPAALECAGPGGLSSDDPDLVPFFSSFQATDDCGAPALSNNAPPIFPSACAPGAVTPVLFQATDACQRSASCTSSVTVLDSTPPEISCPQVLDVECTANGGTPSSNPLIESWRASAAAADACGPAVVADDLPAVVPAGCPPGQTTSVMFTGTDDCGLQASCAADLVVVDREPPSITACPDPLSLECTSSGGNPASDPAIAAFLSGFAAADVCFGVSLSNDAPPFFPSGCEPGTTTPVTFRAVDTCSNASTCPSSVTIRDTAPPAVTPPAALTLECSSQGGVPAGNPAVAAWLDSFQATDICSPQVTRTNNAPPLFPYGCGTGLPTSVHFAAADDCGLEAFADGSLTVRDSTPPSLQPPAPITLECNAPGGVDGEDPAVAAWLDAAQASDICDGATLQNNAPDFFPAGCGPGEATPVTFTTTDDCGNTNSGASSVTVTDTTPPLFAGVPADTAVSCDAVPLPANPNATDTCDNSVDITFLEVRTDGSCPDTYMLARTWTATDDCGNSAAATQEIAVADTTAPELSGVPADAAVECDAVPLPAEPTATDNCDDSADIAFQELRTDGDCVYNYSLTRSWTATDNCGNGTTQTQAIAVRDTTAPGLTCAFEPVLNDEDEEIDGLYTIRYAGTDNCSADVPLQGTVDVTGTDEACDDENPDFIGFPVEDGARVRLVCGKDRVECRTVSDEDSDEAPDGTIIEITGPALRLSVTGADDCGNRAARECVVRCPEPTGCISALTLQNSQGEERTFYFYEFADRETLFEVGTESGSFRTDCSKCLSVGDVGGTLRITCIQGGKKLAGKCKVPDDTFSAPCAER
jgi:hypothetical protein